MNGKIFMTPLRSLALMLATLAVLAVPSFAATVNLVAEEATFGAIPMWGYFEDTGQDCNLPTLWNIGPQINVGPADTDLTVVLRNCLDSDATSLVITGQALPEGLAPTINASGRVTSFTENATAAGGTMTYSWSNLKEGTYLYHSGTHSALQRHMGLYGAAKVEQVSDQAYGVGYDNEQILLYSEIDPALHSSATSAKPLNYKPKYFLVNGELFTAGTLAAGNVNGTILLRLLNAGLKPHVPTLLNGHLQVIAEDGNLYTYPKEQYSAFLAAGKTMDALFVPTAAGTYPLFDRSLHLTANGVTDGGMYSLLEVTDTATNLPPVANAGPDQPGVASGSIVTLDGSLSFDPNLDPITYLWSFTSAPGTPPTLFDATAVSPTFTADLAGTYVLQLVVNDGTSDSAPDTVTITAVAVPVNQPPVAVDDTVATPNGTEIVIDLIANDYDPDDPSGTFGGNPASTIDPATVVISGNKGGTFVNNGDGTVAYTRRANGRAVDSFTYTINDLAGNTSNAATVEVTRQQ